MTTPDSVLERADGDIGYTENPLGSNMTKFGKWYGLDGQPWCAMAVSEWFYDSGLPLAASTSKGFAYCPSGVSWFQRNGRWQTSNPERGDVVFFQWPGESVATHVGIVEQVLGGGWIQTIEGNTNRQGASEGLFVMRQKRLTCILGYGKPPYEPATYGHLNGSVVAIASIPDGYWQFAADGGVFAFGEAKFYGSMGGQPLNKPIVGGSALPSGRGYYLVAADGGVFAFGEAKFYGSMGGQPLNAAVTGIAVQPDGNGYSLTAADGGIFCYGSASYKGSANAI